MKTLPDTNRGTDDTSGLTPSSWRIFLVIVLSGLFVVGIVTYGYYAGLRINTIDSRLVNHAAKVKLEAVTANVVLEGFIADGIVGDIESIWTSLDHALDNLRLTYLSAKSHYPFISLLYHTVPQDKLNDLNDTLKVLKMAANDRLTGGISILKKEADQRYAEIYLKFMQEAGELESSLLSAMEGNLQHFGITQILMIAICLFLTLIMILFFRQFERRRTDAFLFLKNAHDHLEEEISKRMLTENNLRESEERFRQMAENIMDIFWLEDLQYPSRFIYTSPLFEKWWGIKREELYKDSELFWHPLHPEDKEKVKNTHELCIEGDGQMSVEFRIVNNGASFRWIWARFFPIYNSNGEIYRIAGLAQDISTRKINERRQNQLIEELKNYSYIISHDLKAPIINLKGFSEEIQIALDEMKPGIEMVSQLLSQEDRNRIRASMNDHIPEALDFINAAVSKMEGLTSAVLKLSRIGRSELKFEELDMRDLVNEVLDTLAYQIRKYGIRIHVERLPVIVADRLGMTQIILNLINNAIAYRDPSRGPEIKISYEKKLEENIFHVKDNGCGIDPAETERIFSMFVQTNNHNMGGEGVGLAYARVMIHRHSGSIWCHSELGVGSTFSFSLPSWLKKDHHDI